MCGTPSASNATVAAASMGASTLPDRCGSGRQAYQ